MVSEIEAKTIISRTKNPSYWFNVLYNMNIYRGCSHKCIYCDSRSNCYQIENFDDIIVKKNAVSLLKRELSKKRVFGVIGTGAMSDPYIPLEKKYNLTGEALEVIAYYRYPVNIVTKSNLILRDINSLVKINEKQATVSFTLTTVNDNLGKIIEPYATPPSKRLEAMGILSEVNIYVGVTMMPILPFIEDSEENIEEIVNSAHAYGAKYIIPFFGLTMRDGQREYFYEKLDESFKGMKEKYIKTYGNTYSCNSPKYKKLKELFIRLCKEKNIIYDMRKLKYYSNNSAQLSMFDK